MTIKEVFKEWSIIPEYSTLAEKSRSAVGSILMYKYSDIHLEQFTEGFVRRIFDNSEVSQELKIKAASILVYLLQWGAKKGYCKEPSFDYTIASNSYNEIEDYSRPKKIAVYIVDREAQMQLVSRKKHKVKKNIHRSNTVYYYH